MKLIGLTKTLLVVAVLAFVAVPTVAMAQNSVHCDDPNTGKKKWVKIWRIHAMYKDTSEILENEGIHILDLEEDDWKLRRDIEGHWVAKNWCGVYVGMSALDRSLARVTLDVRIVSCRRRRTGCRHTCRFSSRAPLLPGQPGYRGCALAVKRDFADVRHEVESQVKQQHARDRYSRT